MKSSLHKRMLGQRSIENKTVTSENVDIRLEWVQIKAELLMNFVL